MMRSIFWMAAIAMLASSGGAVEAADLGRRAPAAADYVRVCDAYGRSFFYIPGSETCLRIGGYVRVDGKGGDGQYADRGMASASVAAGPFSWSDRTRNGITSKARFALDVDARSQTEFGLLRSFSEIYFEMNSGSASSTVNFREAWIAFDGLTAGRAESFWDFNACGYQMCVNFESVTPDARINLLAYTLSLGKNLDTTISLEDPTTSDGRRQNATSAANPTYGGLHMPDLVWNVRTQGSWGKAQVMAALHEVADNTALAGYTPKTTMGWAIGAGVELDMSFLSKKDQMMFLATYSVGGTGFATQNSFQTTKYGPLGYDYVVDGPNAASRDIHLTKTLGLDWSYRHNFDDNLLGDLSLSLLREDGYDNPASGIYRDFTQYQVMTDLRYTPLRGLMFGIAPEFRYLDFDRKTTESSKQGLKDSMAWALTVRVQHAF